MIRELIDADREAYDAQAQHLMQSWMWGEFRKKLGMHVVRQGEFEAGKLMRGWQITIHAIPHLPYTIGYLPKGPAPDQPMLAALAATNHQYNTIFIQLEPNVLTHDSPDLSRLALRPSAKPLFAKHNFIIDLTLSEDALLAKMHHKTRYNLKLAARKGVAVMITQDDTAFAHHLDLYFKTAQRQKYFGHDRQYHQTLWDTLKQTRGAYLVQAHLPGCKLHSICLVASWMVIAWHDTLYYPYGGSSDTHRDCFASNLVAWEALRLGKRLGLKQLDLWGALGIDANPIDPWYGFHRFKAGYGGEHVTYIGSFDLVLNTPVYTIFTTLNAVRWWFLTHF